MRNLYFLLPLVTSLVSLSMLNVVEATTIAATTAAVSAVSSSLSARHEGAFLEDDDQQIRQLLSNNLINTTIQRVRNRMLSKRIKRTSEEEDSDGDEDDDDDSGDNSSQLLVQQRQPLVNSRRMKTSSFSSTLLPQTTIMRNFALLCRTPSLSSIGFGVACGMGYYFFSPSHAGAKPVDNSDDTSRKHLPFHVVVGRVYTFWKKAVPIIVHYKFATLWMNRIKHFDRDRRDDIYDMLHRKYAPTATDIILDLKGLFIKVGQVLSSRLDCLPGVYIDHFDDLQDNVPAYPSEEIRKILSAALIEHHGLKFNDVFEKFADEPLGTASIGQVHSATLTDKFLGLCDGYSGGREVAVKVMHIDAEDRFRNDFKILKWLCRVALPGWSSVLPELERAFMKEFDYTIEASNLHSVRQNMLASPYKNRVCVPEPLTKYSTKNMLIMERLEGDKLVSVAENGLTRALQGDKNLAKKLIEDRRRAIIDGEFDEDTTKRDMKTVLDSIAHYSILTRMKIMWQLVSLVWVQRRNVDLLLDVHGYQIFRNGQFNGDPHPGNILVLENGQLGLIDYGQCYKLAEEDRLALSYIFQELSNPEVDSTTVSSAMRDFGFRFKYYKEDVVTEMASFLFDSDNARIPLGLPTPQDLLEHLTTQDPMEVVPDPAVFVARTSFLFRGMGMITGMDIRTASSWRNHAVSALKMGKG